MQRKVQPLNIQCEEEDDSEGLDPTMETDRHEEREALLPPQCSNNNADSILHKEPKDRFHIVYAIFLFLGVATLLPWNFFITAKHYFDYKFRNLSLPEGVPYDTSNVTTDLQIHFESYLSITAMLSNLFFITVAMLLVKHISLNCRIMLSLVPIIIIFIITVVFVKVDTDSWQTGFFWFTMVTAAVMVGLTAVLTGSIFGLSCLFPPTYTQAVMSGQALGGTLSALVMIESITISGSPRSSAFWFFLTATVCSALAMVAYFSLYYMKYSRFYMSNQVDIDKGVYEVNVEIPHSRQLQSKTAFFTTILKEIWAYFLSVSLVFFVTLACFPAVVSLIKSVNYTPGDPWTAKYFTPVVCFLQFNVCDFIGRTATHWIRIPRNGQKGWLIFLSLLRVGFLPLFMLCNINADHRKYFPVLLDNDAWPIVLTIALGLTNGYIGTLCMLYGPNHVELDQAEGAGMVMTFGMTLGLASGSITSLLLVDLI